MRLRFPLLFFPFSLSALIASVVLSTSLSAQSSTEDDGVLFFPPQLTVEAASLFDNHMGCIFSFEYVPGVIVMEQINRHSLQLLPILFFDGPGSVDIPQRYHPLARSLDALDYEATLPIVGKQEIAKYHEILDIVGYRLSNGDNQTIMLQGGYSTEPGETAEVGTQRAKTVRDYLVNIWRIDPKRIEVMPSQRFCDSATPLPGQEEARCVRMYSTEEQLFAPLTTTTIYYTSYSIRLNIEIETHLAEGDATAIDIDVILGDSLLSSSRVSCRSTASLHRLSGSWGIPDFKFNARPYALSVQARVHRQNGTVRTSNLATIPITYKSYTDSAEPPLTLPFFHYRDTALNPYQRSALNRIVQDRQEGKFQYTLTVQSEHSEAENGEAWLISQRGNWENPRNDLRVSIEEILPEPIQEEDSFFHETPTTSGGTALSITPLPLESLDLGRITAVGNYISSHTQQNNQNYSRVTTENRDRYRYFYPSNYPEQRYYNRYIPISVAQRPAKTYVNYGAKIEE